MSVSAYSKVGMLKEIKILICIHVQYAFLFLFRKEHSICVSRPARGWKIGQDMSGQAPFLRQMS